MDVTDDGTPRDLPQIEEKIQEVKDLELDDKSADSAEEENHCEQLKEDTAIVASQKQTIEILNIELVTPHSGVFNTSDSNCKSTERDLENCQSENYKVCTLKSVAEIVENVIDNATVPVSDEMVKISSINETNSQDGNSNNQKPNTSKLLNANTTNSLSLLAQYHSDDDDSVVEVPVSAQDYRDKIVEIDSNSDSDTSSDSSDVEYINELRKTIQERIDCAEDEEEDENGNEGVSDKKRHQTKLRVKGEMLLDDLPPIQDLQITVPEDECMEFGKIHSIVNQLVLVNAEPNSVLLDLGTVIFLEKGQKVLGEVFDVLGQVAEPLYCVRFNCNQQIREKQINIGDLAYIAPKTQYTQYVILSNLVRHKGSDASWENDIEPPPRFLDYSDDEEEQCAKRQLRNKNKPVDDEESTKRLKIIEERPPNSNINNKSQTEQRESRGSVGNVHTRPRYSGPHQNQQYMPNQNNNSWHSNYYPQPFPPYPTGSYGMHSAQMQPQSSSAYSTQGPVYSIPIMQNIPYPPPLPTNYGPPIFHHRRPQLMPNAFSIRPSNFPNPHHASHNQQYPSTQSSTPENRHTNYN